MPGTVAYPHPEKQILKPIPRNGVSVNVEIGVSTDDRRRRTHIMASIVSGREPIGLIDPFGEDSVALGVLPANGRVLVRR